MNGDPGARRREAGAASARSLLLTVLGEFVRPAGVPVWTGALVAALADVGVEEKAARQAVSRTAAEGLLRAQRHGRRVRWYLTPAGQGLLEHGAARIYDFGHRVAAWDGRWLVLAVSVPETQRQLRHQLRTRLTWAGLGSPMPGLWVSPDAGKEKDVVEVVAGLGVESFCFLGPLGELGDPQQVVSRAWDLTEVQRRYREFVQAFSAEQVVGAAEAFRAQVQLVQQWRRFPFLDPALPAELLAPDWPGPAAAELFHRCHDEWHARAQQHWTALSDAAATRN